MVSSRRSARVKARKDVAKGSPSKGVKKKKMDNKNKEKEPNTNTGIIEKAATNQDANDGTNPTRKERRNGEGNEKHPTPVDLTGDENGKWEGHLDREHAEKQKYKPKSKGKGKGKVKGKNAFIQAINEGVIEIDKSDAEDSIDEEQEIVFTKDHEGKSDQDDDDMSDTSEDRRDKGNEQPEKMNENYDSDDAQQGTEEQAERGIDPEILEIAETEVGDGHVAQKSVAFPNEDDLGMDDLEETDNLEMEIDENETPAGVEKELLHPDIEYECRYLLIITTQPSTKPFQTLREQLVKFIEHLQAQVGTDVHVSQWDVEGAEEVPTIKKPEDLPKLTGMSKAIYAAYFQGYPSPKRNEEVTMFLRIRFTTEDPKKLKIPLAQIGQTVYDETPEGLGVKIGRNPYPCQAAQGTTLGWLFGSTKAISSQTFIPALRKKLELPDHVPIGVQWRTMKNAWRKQHKWNRDDHPPQAIHIDIDSEYANRYYNVAAKIFKKRSKKRIQGMRLRIVPCFGSDRAKALSTIQKDNCDLMQMKQQYLCNSHITRIETNHILNLDRPVGTQQTTLRKYLMSRAPKGSLVQRLFMSVDLAWKGKGHILVTTKPHYKEAIDMLNTMIPECVHAYGMEAAKSWFSNSGLEAYRGVKWDPKKKSTSSNMDYESMALVEEDLFELGDEWRIKAAILKRKDTAQRDENFVAETVNEVLDKRYDDSDVKSFGSVLGRSHDGDTVQSQKPGIEDTQLLEGAVQFTGMEIALKDASDPKVGGAESLAGTSAAKTTDSVRARLKDTEAENARIRKEYQELAAQMTNASDGESVATAKTTQSTKARCVALTLASEIKDDTLAEQAKEIAELKRLLAGSNPRMSSTAPQDNSNQPVANEKQAPVHVGQAVTMTDGGGKG